jgi:hypothetical protein
MDSNAKDVKDCNLVLIGEHYWEVGISGGFAKLSYLKSSKDISFDGTFQMAFYYLFECNRKAKYCDYIGLSM